MTRSADDVRHPVFARMYAMASPGVERRGAAAHRTEMLSGRLATAQSWLDRSGVWPRVGGGCHSARDTAAAIAASGFTIERTRRFDFPIGPVPVPHVIGVARRV